MEHVTQTDWVCQNCLEILVRNQVTGPLIWCNWPAQLATLVPLENMRWAMRRPLCTWVRSGDKQDDQREDMKHNFSHCYIYRPLVHNVHYIPWLWFSILSTRGQWFATQNGQPFLNSFSLQYFGVRHRRDIPWKGVNPANAESCAQLGANMRLYKLLAYVCALHRRKYIW